MDEWFCWTGDEAGKVGDGEGLVRIEAVSEIWETDRGIGWLCGAEDRARRPLVEDAVDTSWVTCKDAARQNDQREGLEKDGICTGRSSSLVSEQWLQQGQGSAQLLLDLYILRFGKLLLLKDSLKFLLWLLIPQVPNLLLQGLNLGLGPLPDSSLRFPIICPLLRQLLRSKIRNPPRGCSSGGATFLGSRAITIGDIMEGGGYGRGVQRSLNGLSRRLEVPR